MTAPTSLQALAEHDQRILEFEEAHPGHSRAKEDAIRERFDLTPARYYQILGTLIELPSALVAYPVLVHRLRRMRDQRRAQRFGYLRQA